MKGAASALAIHCAEAIRLTPVPKLCGRHQTSFAAAASVERRRHTVSPPARPTSGWMARTPRSISAWKSISRSSVSPVAMRPGTAAASRR